MGLRSKSLVMAVLLGACCVCAVDAKTIKILAVGNSFSANALRYFNEIVEASGNKAIVQHAYIGGCDFDRHVKHADNYARNPEDPSGKPYRGRSLQQLLTADQWEYVTIQQVSHKATRFETFSPCADQLVAYIRKLAPQAEIVVHQTWAYRDDMPVRGKGGFMSTDDMYSRVRRAYDMFCEKNGFRLIPCGDAMQAARFDPAWGKYQPDPDFDMKKAVYPETPQNERFSLHGGYRWRKDKKSDKLILAVDRTHANAKGEYMMGCVWLEFFYGVSAVGNTFVPEKVTAEEAAVLQRIAHRVVTEKYRPEPIALSE